MLLEAPTTLHWIAMIVIHVVYCLHFIGWWYEQQKFIIMNIDLLHIYNMIITCFQSQVHCRKSIVPVMLLLSIISPMKIVRNRMHVSWEASDAKVHQCDKVVLNEIIFSIKLKRKQELFSEITRCFIVTYSLITTWIMMSIKETPKRKE